MSETTTNVVESIKAIKVASKNGNPKTAKTKVPVRDRSSAEVPAKERRVALLKLLRKYQATKATSAKPISFLAEKLGYNPYDVYCLAYHKYPLATQGFVKTVKLEGVNELSVYLTAKGIKGDPE